MSPAGFFCRRHLWSHGGACIRWRASPSRSDLHCLDLYLVLHYIIGVAHTPVTKRAFFVLTVLGRLAAEGLIEPDREESRDGRLRRYYRLTENGRRALALGRPPSPRCDCRGLRYLRAAFARMVQARLRPAGGHAAG
jgi:hypothetical protein